MSHTPESLPPGWLPAALNRGWIYIDWVRSRDLPAGAALSVMDFYAARYPHSDRAVWSGRLAAGEIWCNGQQLRADRPIGAGDGLQWHRSPWQEPAVPVLPSPLFDDGDLVVFNKPSGLPVLPAGGFLEHTLLAQLERLWPGARPVHRLGRFTSGLLVCARRPAMRAWLSAQLRESTAAGPAAELGCRKLYRALVRPGVLPLAPGEALPIEVPIGRRPHPQLGQIWCAADGSQAGDRPARSTLALLEHSASADLVQVAIASGRPHQIRIHCAAVGAPLLGDPLYGPGGLPRAAALPGDGGYQLQAWRLELDHPTGGRLELVAPEPLGL